jgi:hypothetical protein
MVDPQLHVGALLGPPDAWPDQGLAVGVQYVGCFKCGLHFFVVELEEPLYLQKVSVYETGTLGSIIALLATDTYLGNATEWITLWEGISREQDYVDSIFQPPICPMVRKGARYAKVIFDTDIAKTLIDTIGFDGSIEPPTDMVWDDEGLLFYKPLDGIHFSSGDIFQDSIAVSVSNCFGISMPKTLPLAGDTAGIIPPTLFGEPQEVSAVTGEATVVWISFADVQAHLSTALNEAIPKSEFVVEVRSTLNTTSMELFQEDGTPIDTGHRLKLLSDSGTFLSTPVVIVRPTAVNIQKEQLMLWVHARNMTYRTLLIVHKVCPMLATIFECTLSPKLCAGACERFPVLCEVQDGGLVPVTFYNAEKGRCEVLGETTNKSKAADPTFIVIMAGFSVLAASVVFLVVSVPCLHFSYAMKDGTCVAYGQSSRISNSPRPLVYALSSFIARRCPDFFPVGLRGPVKK